MAYYHSSSMYDEYPLDDRHLVSRAYSGKYESPHLMLGNDQNQSFFQEDYKRYLDDYVKKQTPQYTYFDYMHERSLQEDPQISSNPPEEGLSMDSEPSVLNPTARPVMVATSSSGELIPITSDAAAISIAKNGFFDIPESITNPLTAIVDTTMDSGLLAMSAANKNRTSSFQPRNMAQQLAMGDQQNYDNMLMANMTAGKTFGSILGPLGSLLGAMSALAMTPHDNRKIATDVGDRDASQLQDSF